MRRPPQSAPHANGPTNTAGHQRPDGSVTRGDVLVRLGVGQRRESGAPDSVPERRTV
ncbi:MAG: hypothetical protein ACP5I8_12190 [Phycisphaerae bacterium]